MTAALELVCPAGTPASLKAAVDAGADVVYAGFADDTNARNFPGLNFTRPQMKEGIAYAHERGCGVFIAVNTYPKAGNPDPWRMAITDAATMGADAIILADIGLLAYAQRAHPQLRRHLSVQASASNAQAIGFYHRAFGVKRVVLPRVLTIKEIAALNAQVPVETEVFAFGGMCVMAEGRCSLSSYVTGQSPNTDGVCSPASHVCYEKRDGKLISRLGDFTLNIFSDGEAAGYPTLCKGRFVTQDMPSYLFEEPASLNALDILTELAAAGVSALKIEGRQRGRAYVNQVVKTFRNAVDAASRGETVAVGDLGAMSEGGRETTGAYEKIWH
ncbi:MAG: U32 family peptidase [Proteobacteria bacterium]|nr:U32 family peptidase [Pseudomonadota bacterium]